MKTPYFATLLLFVLSVYNYSRASTEVVDVTKLVEVTSKSKAQCIEYFEAKGKIYCSTKPLLNTQIKQEIADAEMLKLNLNPNEWKIGWTDIKPEIATIEYIHHGQTRDNWQELVTTQFFPNYLVQITPKMVALNFLNNLQQQGFSPSVNFYAESSSEILFEFQILSPENQVQDEIQRVIKSAKGMHIVHYAVKKATMDEKERDKWLRFIKAVAIKT